MKKPFNPWKCPACGKLVDYTDSEPSKGRTMCEKSGKRVQMIKPSSFAEQLAFYRVSRGLGRPS